VAEASAHESGSTASGGRCTHYLPNEERRRKNEERNQERRTENRTKNGTKNGTENGTKNVEPGEEAGGRKRPAQLHGESGTGQYSPTAARQIHLYSVARGSAFFVLFFVLFFVRFSVPF
jgi:hypothetical protein